MTVMDDSTTNQEPQSSAADTPATQNNTVVSNDGKPSVGSDITKAKPAKLPVSNTQSKYQYIPVSTDSKNNRLEAQATLVLETKLATSLWRGREGDPQNGVAAITGLTRFAREVGECWREAKLNNPVADYYLIQVEERFNKAKAEIKESMEVLDELMEESFNFEDFDVVNNAKPFSTSLHFNCTWAFLAASLLKDYDTLVKKSLGLKHIGILSEASWGSINHNSGRRLRGLFQSLSSFISVPIDREWFRNPDLRVKLKDVRRFYRMANREMPFLDKAILHGDKRAVLSPPILDKKTCEGIREREPFNGGNMAAKVNAMGLRKKEAIESGRFLVGDAKKKLRKKPPQK